MIATADIKRPTMRYYGGKWRLAPWIISYFPEEHEHYIDLCGGAASVLLQKQRSKIETYNDIDNHTTNFFQVLRDRPDELIRKIRLTPWARAEYELHREPVLDPVERARRFWVGCCYSISGSPYTTSGMRMIKNVDKAPNGVQSWFYADLQHIEQAAMRFVCVQIENKTYQQMIADYDYPGALFYFDPPYLTETRTNGKEYRFEWEGPGPHIEAATLLRRVKGYVVISGYASDLYTDLYETHGWTRFDKKAQTNSGGARIESLWLSPRTTTALNKPVQLEF